MTRQLAGLLALFALIAVGPAWAQAVRNVPRISIDEMKALMSKKQVLVIDVRDAQSFAEGHIPGAVHIPLADIAQHAERLKKEKRVIVTYCA